MKIAALKTLKRHYRQRHLILGMAASRVANAVGLGRPVPLDDLQGWAPFFQRGEELVWVNMRGQQLTSSMVEGDFQRATRRPGSVRVSRIDLLERAAAVGNAPHGLVFHIARCGSTLLRNMLAATDNSLALSEPLILHDVVHTAGDETRRRRLTGAMRTLCHPYRGNETRYYVKLSSACSIGMADFSQCFPATPIIYLYRDPVEVMVAALNEGGCSWLSARRNPDYAARLTGVPAQTIRSVSRTEYAAQAIGNYYRQVAAFDRPVLPINYSRLLEDDSLRAICRLFAIPDEETALERMKQATRKDAKRKGDYVPDADRRRREASAEIASAADRWCGDAYRQLDELSLRGVRDLLGREAQAA